LQLNQTGTLIVKEVTMYYAARVDSSSSIWFVNKTLTSFVKNFHNGDEIIICKRKPNTADYGYYYRIVDGKIKRHPNKRVNVMWLKRELGL
jgi:hypothetical protein